MSKRQKRLERLRQNPNNVSLSDLQRVLEDYGFLHRKTTGSHYSYTYELGEETHLFVVPFRRPVKPIYIKQALKIIDRIVEERGEDEPDDDETDEES
ncbi:MAG: type II toxin-antitoxin system HicA family toxin [Anaerolineae bacterium]|nr:type II toxin-antitoxin system HicA family toxin [Anaerolineae bacterium]